MVVAPRFNPYTVPEAEPTVATIMLPLVHDPPPNRLPRLVVCPRHALPGPVIGASGCTVYTAVAAQPVLSVYEMYVLPALMPFTTPDADPTVATPVIIAVHVPPGVALFSVVAYPWQTDEVPVIAAGTGYTETVRDAVQPVDSV